jgi:hypothetical protein
LWEVREIVPERDPRMPKVLPDRPRRRWERRVGEQIGLRIDRGAAFRAEVARLTDDRPPVARDHASVAPFRGQCRGDHPGLYVFIPT